MILYSNEPSRFAWLRSSALAWLATVLMFHFGSVMNRFRLLWFFLSMKSSLVLLMLCSFLPVTMSHSSVLQKFSNWGLLKFDLNFDRRCFNLRGMPAIKPNMHSCMSQLKNKLWTQNDENTNTQLL